MGLRVLSCFSVEHQTLTSGEIKSLVDLSQEDVTRIASMLTRLGYLADDPSSDEDAWTLVPDN
jgi:DNA-binding IclR family transcriptional regulator